MILIENIPNFDGLGACSEEDPELFFDEYDVTAAKAVCRRCVVVDECLKYAIETDTRHGVWGGMTDKEREKIGRSQFRAQRSS